jgi:hypothetical protein
MHVIGWFKVMLIATKTRIYFIILIKLTFELKQYVNYRVGPCLE